MDLASVKTSVTAANCVHNGYKVTCFYGPRVWSFTALQKGAYCKANPPHFLIPPKKVHDIPWSMLETYQCDLRATVREEAAVVFRVVGRLGRRRVGEPVKATTREDDP